MSALTEELLYRTSLLLAVTSVLLGTLTLVSPGAVL
jgi:hypothetical protein